MENTLVQEIEAVKASNISLIEKNKLMGVEMDEALKMASKYEQDLNLSKESVIKFESELKVSNEKVTALEMEKTNLENKVKELENKLALTPQFNHITDGAEPVKTSVVDIAQDSNIVEKYNSLTGKERLEFFKQHKKELIK